MLQKLNMVRDAVQAASVAAHAGNMHVRCGANAKYPLVPAVTNVIAGALSTVAGVLEEEEIHQVCRVLLGQVLLPAGVHLAIVTCNRCYII